MRRMPVVMIAVACAVASTQLAAAADLPAKAAPAPVPVFAPTFWTGFYGGVNVGYSSGSAKNVGTLNGAPLYTDKADVTGVIGGGQLGYNWQTGNIVWGVEADFQGTGQKGESTAFFAVPGPFGAVPGAEPYTSKLTYLGTVRGRLGYGSDAWMVYGTGGWAYGHETFDGSVTVLTNTVPFNNSTNRNGWVVGGGVEVALFDRHWSWKAEYLHADLGVWSMTNQTQLGTSVTTIKFKDDIFRIGLNYRL